MSYFVLNTKVLKESIQSFKKHKDNLSKNLADTFSNLNNIDSSWNDVNSIKMIEIVKNDRKLISDYLDELSEINNQFYRFRKEIISVCFRYGYGNNDIILEFNDNNISYLYSKINNILSYLEDAYDYLNFIDNIDGFGYNSTVQQMRSNIRNLKSKINKISVDIKQFVSSINEVIENNSQVMRNFDKVDLNIGTNDFIWQKQNVYVEDIKIIEDIEVFHLD